MSNSFGRRSWLAAAMVQLLSLPHHHTILASQDSNMSEEEEPACQNVLQGVCMQAQLLYLSSNAWSIDNTYGLEVAVAEQTPWTIGRLPHRITKALC